MAKNETNISQMEVKLAQNEAAIKKIETVQTASAFPNAIGVGITPDAKVGESKTATFLSKSKKGGFIHSVSAFALNRVAPLIIGLGVFTTAAIPTKSEGAETSWNLGGNVSLFPADAAIIAIDLASGGDMGRNDKMQNYFNEQNVVFLNRMKASNNLEDVEVAYHDQMFMIQREAIIIGYAKKIQSDPGFVKLVVERARLLAQRNEKLALNERGINSNAIEIGRAQKELKAKIENDRKELNQAKKDKMLAAKNLLEVTRKNDLVKQQRIIQEIKIHEVIIAEMEQNIKKDELRVKEQDRQLGALKQNKDNVAGNMYNWTESVRIRELDVQINPIAQKIDQSMAHDIQVLEQNRDNAKNRARNDASLRKAVSVNDMHTFKANRFSQIMTEQARVNDAYSRITNSTNVHGGVNVYSR